MHQPGERSTAAALQLQHLSGRDGCVRDGGRAGASAGVPRQPGRAGPDRQTPPRSHTYAR